MLLITLQIIAFDELKTDYKNPIDQCNSLNPVRLNLYLELIHLRQDFSHHHFCLQLVLPEYAVHMFYVFLFIWSGEWITVLLNLPLIAYNVYRYKQYIGVRYVEMHCICLLLVNIYVKFHDTVHSSHQQHFIHSSILLCIFSMQFGFLLQSFWVQMQFQVHDFVHISCWLGMKPTVKKHDNQ